MDPKCNIMSAKNIKHHGLFDKRWTISDKQTQYRGIIKLHVREAAIKGLDMTRAKQLERQLVRNLVKKNADLRQKLDFEVRGDAQLLRNILACNPALQRAYQNHTIDVVLAHLNQDNFNMRKELDRLKVKIDDRVTRLVNLKLELSVLEDTNEVTNDPIPEEKNMFTLTAKIQDMTLKGLAAISVRQVYIAIRNIMQKDAMYYDKVIVALEEDGIAQSKCIFTCVQMGQLATEYLDDRRSEFVDLEKKIKKEIKMAKEALAETELEYKELTEELSNSISNEYEKPRNRRYDTVDFGLMEELDFAEETLKYINVVTNTSSYDGILPILQGSKTNYERLKILEERVTKDRDALEHKVVHARLVYEKLSNSSPGNREYYVSRKAELLAHIAENKKHIEVTNNLLQKRRTTLANIKVVLQHLAKILERVQKDAPPTSRVRVPKRVSTCQIPDDLSPDATTLVQSVMATLVFLMKNGGDRLLTGEEQANASTEFRKLIERTTSSSLLHETPIEEQSLINIEMEDYTVPTRAEIKKTSAAIVAEELARAERECRI